jgi:hypothetical protein
MAARRLLIVMLILLGISTLVAALVPPKSVRDADSESTSTALTETAPADIPPAGRKLKATPITVGGDQIPVVEIEVGDHLPLTVKSDRADLLEIPALGLVEAVAPGSPAHFDVLATDPGSYGIRFVEADRVVAKIVVEEQAKKKGD